MTDISRSGNFIIGASGSGKQMLCASSGALAALNIRGTAVTSRISAPTEKAEVIQILDYGVNRSLVTITGNGYSLKQFLSIKIMISCRF